MKWDFKTNLDPYYKYMVCYVVELLDIYLKTKKNMDTFNIISWLKWGFEPPYRYLSANVEKVQLKYRKVVWTTNCVDYLKRSIDNVDKFTLGK